MNVHVGFRAQLPPPGTGGVVLYVAASSLYRVHVNGQFVGHGPARAAHGRFRVDEWEIGQALNATTNLVAIEVVGYNVNSYYLLDQPAFLLAEIRAGDLVLASTAGAGVPFEAAVLDDHVQRVERYSVARTFSEAFRLRPDSYAWRTDPGAPFETVACEVGEVLPLLPRRVPYPDFRVLPPTRLVGRGRFERGPMPEEPYRDWTLTGLGPDLKGYREEEFEVATSLEWQAYRTVEHEVIDAPANRSLAMPEGAYHVLDFGVNQTGFIRLRLVVSEPTRLYVLFDEVLTDGAVDPRRLRCLNILDCTIAPGMVEVETLEPYTLRYLQLAVAEGACVVEAISLRTCANPEATRARFTCSDRRVDRLFEAGRETLRQNALDLLMDCPSRERAGWPCDSYFAARAAFLLTGSTTVEHAFLENYLAAPPMDSVPDGMLPMNYPADHPNGDFLGVRAEQFIPNWPLWLVLQLEEYLDRSADMAMIDAFRPRVEALFSWFDDYLNDDGLLEDLPGWVFIEWSRANDFTEGINYPTNMLYAAALAAAGRIYDRAEWRHRASEVRRTIAGKAFDGRFFVDQARREDGELRATTNRTETCQYYAFYFGVATPEAHGELWTTLRTAFGPRRATDACPDVHPSAMLNGYFLRLELLGRYGEDAQALEEMLDYFTPMVEATGTLWEHARPEASCCHGFGSHVVVSICRHVAGLERVSPYARRVELRPPASGFACNLELPLANGRLRIARSPDSRPVLEAPDGFEIIGSGPRAQTGRA